MSWEIEKEYVDKSLGIHRFDLIERGVITQDGAPARYEFTIRLGMGTDGESCGHCNQPVKRDISVGDEGMLIHVVHGQISPHDLAKEKIAELNAFHSRMDAYVTRHKATLYRGPK